MPCAEGDRSDCQPSTSTSGIQAIEFPLVGNLIYHPQHRAWFLYYYIAEVFEEYEQKCKNSIKGGQKEKI